MNRSSHHQPKLSNQQQQQQYHSQTQQHNYHQKNAITNFFPTASAASSSNASNHAKITTQTTQTTKTIMQHNPHQIRQNVNQPTSVSSKSLNSIAPTVVTPNRQQTSSNDIRYSSNNNPVSADANQIDTKESDAAAAAAALEEYKELQRNMYEYCKHDMQLKQLKSEQQECTKTNKNEKITRDQLLKFMQTMNADVLCIPDENMTIMRKKTITTRDITKENVLNVLNAIPNDTVINSTKFAELVNMIYEMVRKEVIIEKERIDVKDYCSSRSSSSSIADDKSDMMPITSGSKRKRTSVSNDVSNKASTKIITELPEDIQSELRQQISEWKTYKETYAKLHAEYLSKKKEHVQVINNMKPIVTQQLKSSNDLTCKFRVSFDPNKYKLEYHETTANHKVAKLGLRPFKTIIHNSIVNTLEEKKKNLHNNGSSIAAAPSQQDQHQQQQQDMGIVLDNASFVWIDLKPRITKIMFDSIDKYVASKQKINKKEKIIVKIDNEKNE